MLSFLNITSAFNSSHVTMTNLEDIKIKECGEPLVKLADVCPHFVIRLDPYKEEPMEAYLRKTVAEKLLTAEKLLPKGMTFYIRDAWRAKKVQIDIFERFVERTSNKHPDWSKQKVLNFVNQFVAPHEGKFASGHMTGGAFDLRIIKNGKRIPMISKSLSYKENAQPIQPKLPPYIQRNRKIMQDALSSVGFTNCHNEYRHWSYGDVQWAQRGGHKTAIYGVIPEWPM